MAAVRKRVLGCFRFAMRVLGNRRRPLPVGAVMARGDGEPGCVAEIYAQALEEAGFLVNVCRRWGPESW